MASKAEGVDLLAELALAAACALGPDGHRRLADYFRAFGNEPQALNEERIADALERVNGL